MNRRQRGFSIVAAIFLLVVLAMLGAFAVRIGAGQQHAVDLAVLSARALSAANAGVEWAARQALASSTCNPSTTLALSEQSLNGFRVTVQCVATTHTEGSATVTIYSIESFAQRGIYGQPDYVSRRVSARFTDANA